MKSQEDFYDYCKINDLEFWREHGLDVCVATAEFDTRIAREALEEE
jgi:hypothetical protein